MDAINDHSEIETTTRTLDTEPDVSSSCGDVTDTESLSHGGVASGGGESSSDHEFEDVEIDGQTYQSDLDGRSDVSGLELDNDSDTGGLEDRSDIEEIADERDMVEVDDSCTGESDDESECDDK